MTAFKLIARSIIHPGNFMLRGDNGACYVYFADPGELSPTALDPSLAGAMVQSYEWAEVPDAEWTTLEDLSSRYSGVVPQTVTDSDLSQPGH